MFTVSCTSDKIWNTTELVAFLAANQHKSIELDINPEAICLTNLGLYDLLDKFKFARVNIYTWNPLEQHSRYNIKLKGINFWFRRTAVIDSALHDWNLSKRFLVLSKTPFNPRLVGCAFHRELRNELSISSCPQYLPP